MFLEMIGHSVHTLAKKSLILSNTGFEPVASALLVLGLQYGDLVHILANT